jgi:hypothetical protein
MWTGSRMNAERQNDPADAGNVAGPVWSFWRSRSQQEFVLSTGNSPLAQAALAWRQVAAGVWRDATDADLRRQCALYASLPLGRHSPWRRARSGLSILDRDECRLVTSGRLINYEHPIPAPRISPHRICVAAGWLVGTPVNRCQT